MTDERPPSDPPRHGDRVPDFTDVVQQAHERDPSAVSESFLREVAGQAPEGADAIDDRPDPALSAMVGSAQRLVDVVARQRGLEAIPDPPQPKPALVRYGWVAAVAIAAAVVLGFGIRFAGQLLSDGSDAQRFEAQNSAAPTAPNLAAPAGAKADTTEQATVHEGAAKTGSGADPGADPGADTGPGHRIVDATDGAVVDIEIDDDDPTEDDATPEDATRQPPVKVRRASARELAELDARAQRLWREGDTAGARRLFREIIRRGGRSSYVELAYGDLFTLAHQTGARRQERTLWRDYLRRFPRGRLADDARASLCRRAKGAQAHACWGEYLRHAPTGSHAAEAKRTLAEKPAK